jgi:hypothetical protein
MSKSRNNESLASIAYPIDAITVSQTYRDQYFQHHDDLAEQAEYWYRDDPEIEEDIHVAADGSLLAGLELLEGARRAGLARVRVTLHDHTTDDPLVNEVRMIRLSLVDNHTTPMTAVRGLSRYSRLLRDPDCPRIPDVPESDPAEMITWQLDCSPEDARRYLQVLRCPRAVHDALDSGDLELCRAARVQSLPQAVQAEIADWIASCDTARRSATPKEMTRLYVNSKLENYALKGVPLADAVRRFRDELFRGPAEEQAEKPDRAILDDVIRRLQSLRGSPAGTPQSEPVQGNTRA